jgi:cytochrome c oxidase cbb3-type subunit III
MRNHHGLCSALYLLAGLSSCHDEARRFREEPSHGVGSALPLSELRPGPAVAAHRKISAAPRRNPYSANAWAIGEGKRLFTWFNCNGCHSNGGGGMGPALMDADWRYGSDPQSVYTSIALGRPNGMPAFGERVTQQQLWQLAAYVRALAGLAPLGAEPGRSDAIGGLEPESQLDEKKPTSARPK